MPRKNKYGNKYLFYQVLVYLALILGVFTFIVIISILLGDDNYFVWGGGIDLDIAAKFGNFIGGFVGLFWLISGVVMLFLVLMTQKDQAYHTQIETQFFNMISHLNHIIESITGTGYDDNTYTTITSRKYLSYLFWKLHQDLAEDIENQIGNKDSAYYLLLHSLKSNPKRVFLQHGSGTDTDLDLLKKWLQNVYGSFYNDNKSQLGHYFRYVYHIIKYIDNSRLPLKNRREYIEIFQAQMMDDELGLLFYHGLSLSGEKNLKPLLEKYNFLYNIDISNLTFPPAESLLYPEITFSFLEQYVKIGDDRQ